MKIYCCVAFRIRDMPVALYEVRNYLAFIYFHNHEIENNFPENSSLQISPKCSYV
jgi:hypothetical protein